MKSNIDDQCSQLFKELKFNKKHRYLIYKVDNEKVVAPCLFRSLKRLEKENNNGQTSYNHSHPKNLECASLIWNTPIMTE